MEIRKTIASGTLDSMNRKTKTSLHISRSVKTLLDMFGIFLNRMNGVEWKLGACEVQEKGTKYNSGKAMKMKKVMNLVVLEMGPSV
jgi:hypothetical protein